MISLRMIWWESAFHIPKLQEKGPRLRNTVYQKNWVLLGRFFSVGNTVNALCKLKRQKQPLTLIPFLIQRRKGNNWKLILSKVQKSEAKPARVNVNWMKFKEGSQTDNNEPLLFFSALFDGVGVVFRGGQVWGPHVRETVASVRKDVPGQWERLKCRACFCAKGFQKKMQVTEKSWFWGGPCTGAAAERKRAGLTGHCCVLCPWAQCPCAQCSLFLLMPLIRAILCFLFSHPLCLRMPCFFLPLLSNPSMSSFMFYKETTNCRMTKLKLFLKPLGVNQ